MYNPYLPQMEENYSWQEEETAPQRQQGGKTAHPNGLLDSLRELKGLSGLRDILGRFRLDRLDSGDFLLLLVALLLWREGEERDFAIALGLVLLLELFEEDTP